MESKGELKGPIKIKEEIKTNILKMIKNRKWIPDSDPSRLVAGIDENTFTISLNTPLNRISTYMGGSFKKGVNDKIITVRFCKSSQLYNLKAVLMLDEVTSLSGHKIILVENLVNKYDRNEMPIMQFIKHIEVFSFLELMKDLFSHVTFPLKMELLTDESKEKVKETYNILDHQFPKQLEADPASRYLYAKHGQLLKIIRTSKISSLSVVYRIVST